MKAVHATSHKESTHKKKGRTSCQATQSTGPDNLVKWGARRSDGKQTADVDFETSALLHRNAERAAKGHGRQHVEHQFCSACTVDREAIASGKTRRTA